MRGSRRRSRTARTAARAARTTPAGTRRTSASTPRCAPRRSASAHRRGRRGRRSREEEDRARAQCSRPRPRALGNAAIPCFHGDSPKFQPAVEAPLTRPDALSAGPIAIRSPIVVPIGPVRHRHFVAQLVRQPDAPAADLEGLRHLGRPSEALRDAGAGVGHRAPGRAAGRPQHDPPVAAGVQHDVGDHLVDREHEAVQPVAGVARPRSETSCTSCRITVMSSRSEGGRAVEHGRRGSAGSVAGAERSASWPRCGPYVSSTDEQPTLCDPPVARASDPRQKRPEMVRKISA